MFLGELYDTWGGGGEGTMSFSEKKVCFGNHHKKLCFSHIKNVHRVV